MRFLSPRLLTNGLANTGKSPVWQDPVYGYFEQHGPMVFKLGEEYGLTDAQKKAVLHRHRVKEILKKEFLRREYDPHHYKYRHGVVIDAAMFRWYACDRTIVEKYRYTPRTMIFVFAGMSIAFIIYIRVIYSSRQMTDIQCREGERLWWDRQQGRFLKTSGHGVAHCSSTTPV